MTRSLRILFVDDCQADALLLSRHIQSAGYAVESQRVEDRESLQAALAGGWDLIVSDYAMGDFDGPEALETVRASEPDVPFIIVSGAVGEDKAVELMRAGAQDIITKGNLSRLVPAIERELEEAARRRRLRSSEEALARSERLRLVGQMAAGLSHDLRNLLNPLALNIQLAERAVQRQLPETVGGHLRDARTALGRCVELLERLRSYARSGDAGGYGTFDLAALALEAEELSKPRMACRGTMPSRFHRRLEATPPLRGNANEILNALVNLIVNAIEAMPQGGTITLRCGGDAQYAWVEVEDDGTGISAEVQERVFEPFFTTKGTAGTGLGLAMVSACMEHHHGSIEWSSSEGVGTRIRLLFPRAEVARGLESEFSGAGDGGSGDTVIALASVSPRDGA